MKAVAAVLSLCCASFSVSAATPASVQFTGVVQQDALPPVALDLQLPSQQAATVQLSSGFNLELTTPGNSASPDGARIRLLSSKGEVMHTARVPDAGLASVSFAYQVCAGNVTYMSPAPAVVPACRVSARLTH